MNTKQWKNDCIEKKLLPKGAEGKMSQPPKGFLKNHFWSELSRQQKNEQGLDSNKNGMTRRKVLGRTLYFLPLAFFYQ